MEPTPPLVYLVFGLPGSGRREVLLDLIEGGLAADSQTLYFRAKGEPTCPFDAKLQATANLSQVEWRLDAAKVAHGKINAAPNQIFFLAPGTCDPADCAEALKAWTDHNGCQIARLITVVNCSFLKAQPKLKAWYDACIHFSDVVLLNRRENVDNKWLKEFEADYRKTCTPARFLLVKKGRVSNPAEILDPEARRVSLYFDELIPIEDDEFEDEHQPEDRKPDPYIERLESGQRAKPIPLVAPLLPEEGF